MPGEDRALAAFRAARAAPSAAAYEPPARHPMWSRVLVIKTAVAAGVVAITGVAVAAGTGIIPNPVRIGTPSATHSASANASASGTHPTLSPEPGSPTSTAPATAGSATPSGSAPSSPGGGPSTPGTGVAGGTGSAAKLVALCQTFEKLSDKAKTKTLQSTAYQALVSAAGSADQVPAYCEALLPQPTSGATTTSSSPAPRPSSPTSAHPTKQISVKPRPSH